MLESDPPEIILLLPLTIYFKSWQHIQVRNIPSISTRKNSKLKILPTKRAACCHKPGPATTNWLLYLMLSTPVTCFGQSFQFSPENSFQKWHQTPKLDLNYPCRRPVSVIGFQIKRSIFCPIFSRIQLKKFFQ